MNKSMSPRGHAAAAPLSVRLTPEERKSLETAASGAPLSTYIRARLFDGDDTDAAVHPPDRLAGRDNRAKQLARIIMLLGQSEIARSLREIADAASSGLLVLDPATKAEIERALSTVAEIRRLLLRGLGLRPGARQ